MVHFQCSIPVIEYESFAKEDEHLSSHLFCSQRYLVLILFTLLGFAWLSFAFERSLVTSSYCHLFWGSCSASFHFLPISQNWNTRPEKGIQWEAKNKLHRFFVLIGKLNQCKSWLYNLSVFLFGPLVQQLFLEGLGLDLFLNMTDFHFFTLTRDAKRSAAPTVYFSRGFCHSQCVTLSFSVVNLVFPQFLGDFGKKQKLQTLFVCPQSHPVSGS